MKKHKKKIQEEVYKIKSAQAYSTYSADKYCPEEVGNYSLSSIGNVVKCNTTEFPRLVSDKKRFPLDLNVGLEDFIREDHKKESMKNQNCDQMPILRWICATNYNVHEDQGHVIASRGTFRKLGYTLYDHYNSPWCFNFCKYQGNLYICEEDYVHEDDSDVEYMEGAELVNMIRMCGMGKYFEGHVTSSLNDDTHSCYRVVRASLGKYRTLLSAEIDAVREKVVDASGTAEAAATYEYLEIKTCFEKAVRKKLSHGWLQSYLAGVETLYFGFRERSGMVRSTAEYKVAEIPQNCPWDGGAMFGLINGILNWVDSKLEDGTACTLNYRGIGKDVVLTRDGEQFLPPWFVYHVDNFDYLDYDDDLE